MLNAVIGTLLGFLAGLGVGGGSLLILWLTMVMGMDQVTARAVNLMFFIPAAVIAVIFRGKQGNIKWKQVLPAIISGCIAAALFSYFSDIWDVEKLKKAFGVLLILTGLREVSSKEKK